MPSLLQELERTDETRTRIHLPLPAALAANGKITVQMHTRAGPHAVISELWLLRREASATGKKRVLILTGDDFKGHRWRETGPEGLADEQAMELMRSTVIP